MPSKDKEKRYLILPIALLRQTSYNMQIFNTKERLVWRYAKNMGERSSYQAFSSTTQSNGLFPSHGTMEKAMPPKIRQLKAALSRAGFTIRSGKGSHTVWHHPDAPEITVTLSGKDGNDAKPYQIDDVQDALKQLRREK